MSSLKYFNLSEFDSPDAIGSGINMQESTLYMLDKCRKIAGIPLIINSGYRTPEHNRRVGGVKTSAHLQGFAVDISCRNSVDRFKIINAALLAGFNRIGVSSKFIHLDNQPNKPQNVIWTY